MLEGTRPSFLPPQTHIAIRWRVKAPDVTSKRSGDSRRGSTETPDHVLSKCLVHSMPEGTTLVFENLSAIHETSPIASGTGRKKAWTRRKLHSWTFAQLFAFVDYKAQERGVHVERVDPRHTSQTCSRCGYQARTNRRSQARFRCHACGYELNADLNADYNIRDTYRLASRGTPVGSGLSEPSRQPAFRLRPRSRDKPEPKGAWLLTLEQQ